MGVETKTARRPHEIRTFCGEEDHLTADWQAREFEPGPTVFAEWAVTGGLDGNTRRQAGVEAGGKFLTERSGDKT